MTLSEKIDEIRSLLGEGKKRNKKEAAYGPGDESPPPSVPPQPSEPMGGTRKKVKFTGKKFERKKKKH